MYVIMGAGCGQSSVGEALAIALGGHSIDGDDMDSPDGTAKMQAGMQHVNNNRWPWLGWVGTTVAKGESTIIPGCSALKRAYRDRIRQECQARNAVH